MPHYHEWFVIGDDDNDGGVAVAVTLAVVIVIGHMKETGSDTT